MKFAAPLIGSVALLTLILVACSGGGGGGGSGTAGGGGASPSSLVGVWGIDRVYMVHFKTWVTPNAGSTITVTAAAGRAAELADVAGDYTVAVHDATYDCDEAGTASVDANGGYTYTITDTDCNNWYAHPVGYENTGLFGAGIDDNHLVMTMATPSKATNMQMELSKQ